MTNLIIPYSFIQGTKANADEINENFNVIAKTVNDLLAYNETLANKDLSNLSSNAKKMFGDSIPLFAVLIMGRELKGAEAEGWVLQGSSFTKAVYPDAYNMVYDIMQSGVDLTDTVKISNLDGSASSKTIPCKVLNGMKAVDTANQQVVDELYHLTGTSMYFVVDTVNETVRLPKNDNFFAGTSDVNSLNMFTDAGLPNITGATDWATQVSTWFSASGALRGYSDSNAKLWGSNNAYTGHYEINASLSNPLYGASDTVTPRNVKQFIYYRLGNTVKSTKIINLDNIISEVNLQVDNSINRIQKIVETYNDGTSFFRVWSDGFIEQGGETPQMQGTSERTISFIKPYTSFCNICAQSCLGTAPYSRYTTFQIKRKTLSSFVCQSEAQENTAVMWHAIGK